MIQLKDVTCEYVLCGDTDEVFILDLLHGNSSDRMGEFLKELFKEDDE